MVAFSVWSDTSPDRCTTAVPASWLAVASVTPSNASRADFTWASQWPHIIPLLKLEVRTMSSLSKQIERYLKEMIDEGDDGVVAVTIYCCALIGNAVALRGCI